MKILAIVGDSHTWGQGVGAESALCPPAVGGDLRPTDFAPPHYVNLLRDRVNAATGSGVAEYDAAALAREGAGSVADGAAVFADGRARFCVSAAFSYARLFVRVLPGEPSEPVRLHCTLDGELLPEVTFSAGTDAWNDGLIPLHFLPASEGRHTLTVSVAEGPLRLYRLECYAGAYAVVNCAVGSCPVAKYLDLYYDRYVKPMHPFGALFEGCTINDWLTGEGPKTYAALVRQMLDRLRADGIRTVCHTVFPIDGSQTAGSAPACFADYVEAGREAATDAGAPVVDCYGDFLAKAAGSPEGLPAEILRGHLADIWHPNVPGHAFYADEIYPVLAREMGIV